MLVIQNEHLQHLIEPEYSLEQLVEINHLLTEKGALDFPALSTGLFSASIVTPGVEYTGYHSAWVRDNVNIAYAHYVNGRREVAVRVIKALCKFFWSHKRRFEAVIQDPKLAADPMNRPHVRFDGTRLQEVDAKWAHAQNDALGYFLWLYSIMAREGAVHVEDADAEILNLFLLYLNAIRYWEDEDSGHWEETRKASASSIGVVLGGLREFKRLRDQAEVWPAVRQQASSEMLDGLLERGAAALQSILPAECVQADLRKNRRYDAALLFLVYPMRVVAGDLADSIVQDVISNLQGDYGIKRYIGDSFWCADYRQVSEERRTADYSDDVSGRDAILVPSGEAQWCLFDPIVSAYFGMKYHQTRERSYLAKQTEYLNRSLGQVTGSDSTFGKFKCPELYHREKGRIEPSDATPLLWTQANLWLALRMMEQSLRA